MLLNQQVHLVAFACLTIHLSSFGVASATEEEEVNELTLAEQAKIRRVVYDDPLVSGSVWTEKGAQRALKLPQALQRLYEKKPIQVLELLQQIVKGGNPRDSQYAMSYAYGLAVDTIAVADGGFVDTERFDEPLKSGKDTLRTLKLKALEKIIASVKAEIAKNEQEGQRPDSSERRTE